jgi:hypothetical protein
MFVFLVAYRARHPQTFRRQEIITMLESIKLYFTKHTIEYKIVIIEQNNNNYFNRGVLLNAAFIEAEKLLLNDSKYIHFNTDYKFNQERPFPSEFLNHTNGFLDLYRPGIPVLGAACVFNSESYIQINGFPNDLHGWGGDDWAIYNRIIRKNIPILTPPELFNSGFILDETLLPPNVNDNSRNEQNMELAKRDDIDSNGINSCVYTIDGNGEFHNGTQIFHFLITSPLFELV